MNQTPKKNKTNASSNGLEHTTDIMSEFGIGKKAAAPKSKAPARSTVKNYDSASGSQKPAGAQKKSASSSSKGKSSSKTQASTATKNPPARNAKGKAGVEGLRSKRPAHQAIPYILWAFAILIGVALLLNLFCNFGNHLENDPAAHWMGKIGYYICFALFGLFGPAVFALPFLLINLAIYWKKYIDNRLATSKIIVALLAMILMGALIHIFCLIPLADGAKDLSAATLLETGAEMTGGGVIGGKVGYFLYQYGSYVGGILICIILLVASLFYFLGMTPQYVWNYIRARQAEKKARREEELYYDPDDEDEPVPAPAKPEKKNLFKREPKDENNEEYREARSKKQKSSEDKMAPMPMPKLDPTEDEAPFVPSDVNSKMSESAPTSSAPSAKDEKATPAPAGSELPKLDPALNKDTAVDPIFPKSAEGKQVRRVPKEYRNFDLQNIFTGQDAAGTPERKHAPIPPEVPLSGTANPNIARPAGMATQPNVIRQPATGAQQPQMRPATPGTPQQPPMRPGVPGTAQAPQMRQGATVANGARPMQGNPAVRPVARPAGSPAPAPIPNPAAPNVQKTVFRQAQKPQQQNYGLSDEEFEKLEAQRTTLPTGDKKPTEVQDVASAAAEVAHAQATPTRKYVFPPISYLHPGEPMTAENRAEIEANMRQLAETLASFRVRVQEINFSCGPTVTRYEVVLAPGVRVRTVTTLADDIALALRSSGGVRIEAPIPGTNAVGIEVPNKTRSTIYLRDLIESKAFTEAKSKLAACLGADIAGAPLIFDIAKMPHLLVAGTTGSGKSVCINCIIMSLLYKVRPDEVKLVLIDPKKVEFSIYKNIPHLMAPVVTLPKDAAGALQASVEEMERRFEVFESVGVRDLKGYNEITKDDPDMPYIPHIVIIIDELADLMMTAKNEVETAICRIAQKARAAGMHLIIGTQRPSTDVVTGLIKANVPSSIAFAVKSQIDSRVILDHGGAEALTGRGDMLFVPIGAMRDTRVQGAFVDDKEVEKICEFIRATNGTAQYDEKFTAKLKELAAQCGGAKAKQNDDLPVGADGEKGDDPKYADAVRIAVEEKRISTSLLQRKLEVGYSRAAKLIDRMQAEGIVSPPDGSKARTILITPEQYLERFFDEKNEEE